MKHHIAILTAFGRREWLVKQRKLAECLHPILFFILVISLFPLAVGAEDKILVAIGAGVIWVAVILACLLSVPSVFQYDYWDGSLEQLLLSAVPLSELISIKIAIHWVFVVLPLIVLTPLLVLFYGLSAHVMLVLMLTLCLGTPTLMLLTMLAGALTVGLLYSGFLVALILLPLVLPVLIFATGAVMAVADNMPVMMPIIMLVAFLLLAIATLPLLTAYVLRLGMGFY